jgi:hypothetical protein
MITVATLPYVVSDICNTRIACSNPALNAIGYHFDFIILISWLVIAAWPVYEVLILEWNYVPLIEDPKITTGVRGLLKIYTWKLKIDRKFLWTYDNMPSERR